MFLKNFQTLLLLLQVAICAGDNTSALPGFVALTAAPSTQHWLRKRSIAPEVIGSTSKISAYSASTTWSCPLGSTWTTLYPYGNCRTTETVQKPIYTGCTNGSVMLGPFDADTCTGTSLQTSCVTGWIHYNNNITITNFECWPTWTQGNWEAWREDPRRISLATEIAVAVVVPIVVISLVVGGLWWWRRRRQRRQREKAELLEGRTQSMASTLPSRPKPRVVAIDVEKDHDRSVKELEEQRRVSEMSDSIDIGPRGSLIGTLGQVEEERDDASSYKSASSRQARHELQGYEPPADDGHYSNARRDDRGGLQRVLQRFRM